jgi:hypothetical protein
MPSLYSFDCSFPARRFAQRGLIDFASGQVDQRAHNPLLEIASLPSPRLRTAPTAALEEHNYSMDLCVAKWGPMQRCNGAVITGH